MPAVLLQAPQPITGATDMFLQAGLTGALCVIFGAVIVMLWRDGNDERHSLLAKVEEVQNKRVAELQETQTKLLAVIDRSTSALTTVSTTMEQQRETMLEIRSALQELAKEVRE